MSRSRGPYEDALKHHVEVLATARQALDGVNAARRKAEHARPRQKRRIAGELDRLWLAGLGFRPSRRRRFLTLLPRRRVGRDLRRLRRRGLKAYKIGLRRLRGVAWRSRPALGLRFGMLWQRAWLWSTPGRFLLLGVLGVLFWLWWRDPPFVREQLDRLIQGFFGP